MPKGRRVRWAAYAAGASLLLGCTVARTEGGGTPPSPVPMTHVLDTGNCDLAVTATEGRAAATHRSVILVFVNEGAQECAIQGYPDVLALDATHTSVPAEQTPSGFLGGVPDPVRVDLAPGAEASAMIEAMAIDPDTGDACTPYLSIKVTPPGGTTSELPWPGDGCSRLEVHPVVAGRTGTR